MALFGNEETAAQGVAARAEAERLRSLPVPELAAAVMPAYGPEGPSPGDAIDILRVLSWLMDSHPRGTKFPKDLQEPLREGNQALENAGLIVQLGNRGAGAERKATRLGEQALAERTVRSHLAD